MTDLRFVKTDGSDEAFIENCRQLDLDLDRRIGKDVQQSTYDRYNQLGEIRHAITVYEGDTVVGAGALREYSYGDISDAAELKRIHVKAPFQGRGIGTQLTAELVRWAAELGYEKLILETGRSLKESIRIYEKNGFEVIENYGPYRDIPGSICMMKRLKQIRALREG